MVGSQPIRCTAFHGHKRIASGELLPVALKAKQVFDSDKWAQVLIFDDSTSDTIEVDFRGTADDVRNRLSAAMASAAKPSAEAEPRKGPGRPKLGVVAREVTLLPRHWDWLASQPGGASVTLRKLVEEARKANERTDRVRQSREAAYKFLSVMAGNLPDFEEVTRALFAGDHRRFEKLIRPWPLDIRKHVQKLTAESFDA